MIMIIMKAAMEAGMMIIVMGEREIMGIKMMIGMAEIMKIDMAEMCTEMMITAEGVEALTITKMAQAGALIETVTMMVNQQVGTY